MLRFKKFAQERNHNYIVRNIIEFPFEMTDGSAKCIHWHLIFHQHAFIEHQQLLVNSSLSCDGRGRPQS